jgi:hypothetical protein
MWAFALSASAPNHGASIAKMKLEVPLATPNQNVLVVALWPTVSVCLKNNGKKTTITVVAYAELAQS